MRFFLHSRHQAGVAHDGPHVQLHHDVQRPPGGVPADGVAQRLQPGLSGDCGGGGVGLAQQRELRLEHGEAGLGGRQGVSAEQAGERELSYCAIRYTPYFFRIIKRGIT